MRDPRFIIGCMVIIAAILIAWYYLPKTSDMPRPPAKIVGGGAA